MKTEMKEKVAAGICDPIVFAAYWEQEVVLMNMWPEAIIL